MYKKRKGIKKKNPYGFHCCNGNKRTLKNVQPKKCKVHALEKYWNLISKCKTLKGLEI